MKTIVEWLRATRKTTFVAGFIPNRLIEAVVRTHEITAEIPDQAVELAGTLLDSITRNVDISSVSIPVVTYSGPESELPEIFERINQSGTKLSKYEVFAATWMNESGTQISSSEIRTAINEKYSSLIEKGFAIDGLESDESIRDFNLFEYLFGFGKTLVRSHPLLFAEHGDPAETEPSAFSISCVVRGHQLSLMHKLPEFMPTAADGIIDPTDMETAIKLATTEVENWLRPYIGLRLNASSQEGIDFAHGELQIVSMIARAVAGRWDCRGDWSELPGWKEDWDALKRAMPQHYLIDLIDETWRGPIYSTAYNRVWATDDDSKITGTSQHYSNTIPRRVFRERIDGWFGQQVAREQRSRPYVRAIDRTFLRFVYSGLVSHKLDTGTRFELEHLYPVSRLKKIIAASGGPGWPISSIANLALFTKSLNREKSSKTITEHLASTNLSAGEKQKLLKLLLCEVESVSINDSTLTRDDYIGFLRARWINIRKELETNLEIED